MKRLTTVLAVILPVMLIAGASPAATPSPQVVKLQQQVRAANSTISDLQDQVSQQDQALDDQSDTITRLRYRLANQPDPLDVITARGPDGLWTAMRAIWAAFPTLDATSLCGYDRSNTPGDGDGLTVTSFSFYRFGGC